MDQQKSEDQNEFKFKTKEEFKKLEMKMNNNEESKLHTSSQPDQSQE